MVDLSISYGDVYQRVLCIKLKNFNGSYQIIPAQIWHDLTYLTIVWWVLSYSDLAKGMHAGIFVWVILTSLGRPVPTYPLPASSRTIEPVQFLCFFLVVFQQQRFSNKIESYRIIIYHSHIFPHIPTYSHIFPHIPTYSHIFPHIPTYSHIFPHIPTYSHIFPHIQIRSTFYIILSPYILRYRRPIGSFC